MSIYFNHNELQRRTRHDVSCCLIEMLSYSLILKEQYELRFYDQFWNISLQDGLLSEYIYDLDDRDEAKTFILLVMNSGSGFNESSVTCIPTVVPEPIENEFIQKLICICFEDKPDAILSLSGEQVLIHLSYDLHHDVISHRVANLTGKRELENYLMTLVKLISIADVFLKLEKNFPNIIILGDAKKSAQKHNFYGCYNSVYETIAALESIELQALENGATTENRQETFKKITGFDISGESENTLRVPRYYREREFTIPGVGKKLFQWHIKIGQQTRIHYYMDIEEKKIYIGHCGKHLGTSTYSS